MNSPKRGIELVGDATGFTDEAVSEIAKASKIPEELLNDPERVTRAMEAIGKRQGIEQFLEEHPEAMPLIPKIKDAIAFKEISTDGDRLDVLERAYDFVKRKTHEQRRPAFCFRAERRQVLLVVYRPRRAL
jgi:hypothetical protein